MKILSKNKIAMCVGAVLGTAAIVPSAYALSFAADGLGDSLSNYYTTHNGNATLINYTNTSDRTIAMRVRLHEYRNSRSWDFTVILSPYDVWNATIADGGSLGPVIYTGDESCTIPAISRDAANPTVLATTGFLDAIAGDGGPQNVDRLKQGYVNAIVMGSKTAGNGVGLEPDSCAMETARFTSQANNAWDQLINQAFVRDITALNGFLTTGGYPEYTNNAIKGVFNVLNVPLGQNAAQGMDTLADFFARDTASAPYATAASGANPASTVPQYPAFATTNVPPVTGGNPKNLVTLQLHPTNIPLSSGLTGEQRYLASFFLPTQASANTAAFFVNADNSIATNRALPVVSARAGAMSVAFLHQATDVINMWTALQNEAAWDTATDIVIMADVKKFFVDGPAVPGDNPLQGRYKWTPGLPVTDVMGNGVATAPFSERFGVPTAGLSCDPVSWDIWDREENWDPQDPRFSPQPWGLALCFETNVIGFNGVSALRAPVDQRYNIATIFAKGWIDINLISEANRYTATWGATAGTMAFPFAGLPVASWGFTTRVADSGLNEAVSFPSALLRNPPTPTLGTVTLP